MCRASLKNCYLVIYTWGGVPLLEVTKLCESFGPKVDNILGWALPSKSAFLWGRIYSKPASNLSALGPSDPYGFVFFKRCEQFLRLALTSKKDVPYSCLISLGWRQVPLQHMLAKNKTVWVLRPQSRKTDCGLGTNPPPQKGTFWRAVPIQEYCLLWGRMPRMALLPVVRAHLPTYKAQGSSFLDLLYTCVIVVHSCLQLRLIRHEWTHLSSMWEQVLKTAHIACKE